MVVPFLSRNQSGNYHPLFFRFTKLIEASQKKLWLIAD